MINKLKKIVILSFVFVVFFTGTVFASDLKPGEVSFEKQAEWIDKENGIAKVTLKVASEPVVKPADVILLVDRSNSMTFSNNKWDLSGENGVYSKCMNEDHWIDGRHYYDITNVSLEKEQDVYDKEKGCTDRFDVTIDSVNKFLDIYYNYSNENRVAFVSFCNFSTDRFNEYFTTDKLKISNDDEENLGIIQVAQNNIGAGTSYFAGFNSVMEYVKKRNLEETGDENTNSRPTYVIFLTDGNPTDREAGVKVAEELKDMGVIIYSIGIDQTTNTYLSKISTESNDGRYYKSVSSADELDNFYESIAYRIYNAGTSAYITDVISEDFEYYETDEYFPTATPILKPTDSENGKTIQWFENELLKGEKSYEFYIKLKDGEEYDNGSWNTNKLAELSYKNVDLEDSKIEADSPSLSRHKYVVEHYLENEDGTYSDIPSKVEEYPCEEGDIVKAISGEFDMYTFNPNIDGTVLEGVVGSSNKVTLKLYYEKLRSNVVVRYVDENGIDIIDKIELNGIVGTNYTTDKKDIYGYSLDGEEPVNKNGVYTENEQEVIYKYKRIIGKVIVEYIDINGNKIAGDTIQEGYVGESYNISRKDIEGYVAYKEEPSNSSGEYIDGEILVTYVYELQDLVDTSDINIMFYVGIVLLAIAGIVFALYKTNKLSKVKNDKNNDV